MQLNSKILITGANGLVGQSFAKHLQASGYNNLICHTRQICDLTNKNAVLDFFNQEKPEYVFHLASKVYGVSGRIKHQYEILHENSLLNLNIVDACRIFQVKKLLAFGSIALFPNLNSEVPFTENDIFLANNLYNETEISYSTSKRLLLNQLLALEKQFSIPFSFVISSHIYGKYDNFDMDEGRVIPALIAKFHHAKINKTKVKLLGNPEIARDFMFSEDVARALVIINKNCTGLINLATGISTKITTIADILQKITGVEYEKQNQENNPPPNRSIDITKLQKLKFTPQFDIEAGLRQSYEWYASQQLKK